jgi:hypothetical protein
MAISVFAILLHPLFFMWMLVKSYIRWFSYILGKESPIDSTSDVCSEKETTENVCKYYLKGILPQFMLIILLTQQFSLLIMGIEAFQNSFYPTKSYLFLALRYVLITVTYFMFSKDYKSLA